MNALSPATVNASELRTLLNSAAAPRVLDVRTPGEFGAVHIAGAYNVPLDLQREHRDEIRTHFHDQVVLVCRSGQRAAQAEETLRTAGLSNVHIRLPHNRGAGCDAQTIVSQLVSSGRTEANQP